MKWKWRLYARTMMEYEYLYIVMNEWIFKWIMSLLFIVLNLIFYLFFLLFIFYILLFLFLRFYLLFCSIEVDTHNISAHRNVSE